MLRGSFGVGGSGGGVAAAAAASAEVVEPPLAALAARVAVGLRSRVAAVLPRAYSRLPLPRAAALLGFAESEEAAFASFITEQTGWAVAEGALSLPRPSSAPAAAPAAAAAVAAGGAPSAVAALAAGEDELAKLSKYILQLEAGA